MAPLTTVRNGVNVDAAVPALLRQAGHDIVMPLFQRVEAEEKAPGELVTRADRECEEFLTGALRDLVPGSVVVGEESAHADPQLLAAVDGPCVWLVDPVDGTANFARGRSPFSIMVALLHDGDPMAAWLCDPQTGVVHQARRGGGAWRDGDRVHARPAKPSRARIGAVSERFLPDPERERVQRVLPRLGPLRPMHGCAGQEYADLVDGLSDFVLFWRTLPWDHVPGCLVLREAGGCARRLDGSEYRAGDHGRLGLLAARDTATWQWARDILATAGL